MCLFYIAATLVKKALPVIYFESLKGCGGVNSFRLDAVSDPWDSR